MSCIYAKLARYKSLHPCLHRRIDYLPLFSQCFVRNGGYNGILSLERFDERRWRIVVGLVYLDAFGEGRSRIETGEGSDFEAGLEEGFYNRGAEIPTSLWRC